MSRALVKKTGSILDAICQKKEEEIAYAKLTTPLKGLKARIRSALYEKRDFRKRISPPGIHLIAEIKKASPVAGIMRKLFSLTDIAKEYERYGASAISVVTDKTFFGGSNDFMPVVKENTSLPLLRKDFILDEYQVYESKALGADAILLIVSILPPTRLKDLFQLAGDLSMDVLVEIHSRKELEDALGIHAKIIGINMRDLKTFRVDLKTFARLAKEIPRGHIIVAESGIEKREDVTYLKRNGAHAILVGSALMKAIDLREKVKELLDPLP